MDKIVVRGGRPLRGEVEVSGAKNAALPLLAASLLCEGSHRLRRVPDLADVRTMLRLLGHMGAKATRSPVPQGELWVEMPSAVEAEAPYELVKTMRASVLVLGPLLARVGKARVSLPGGCAIGARPIDQHLKGLAALGAELQLAHGYVEARASRLRGATIHFDVVTVTGTENLMMAASLADGQTVLHNAAREPEVVDLAKALNGMGARVEGAGSDRIVIDGVESLRPLDHTVIADRIEGGTLMVAAALTGGEVWLRGLPSQHVEALSQVLRAAGAELSAGDEKVGIQGPARPASVDLRTEPYPGFPTDMQAQCMVLMAVARGCAVLEETVFENRFMHVLELSRMGADIAVNGRRATVRGVDSLSGAQVMATDLRASASLVLAGLVAEGQTEVHRVYHLDRGYERLELKLQQLGAEVRRATA